jgi:AcrR family transcriptional regulator
MQAPPGRAPTNARSRRTRTALLAAARAVLEEHGFPQLTMAAIAERAGVTRRAVYLHFGSRSDLVGALFDYVAETEGLQVSLERVRTASTSLSALDAWAWHEATYHVRILGVARALEHVGRADPDAAAWRERIAQHQLADCRLLAERLAHERHVLGPVLQAEEHVGGAAGLQRADAQEGRGAHRFSRGRRPSRGGGARRT